jgi:hypothetical protein
MDVDVTRFGRGLGFLPLAGLYVCSVFFITMKNTYFLYMPPADRWRGPRVARGLRGQPLRWRPLAHRTVRCTTGHSGEL